MAKALVIVESPAKCKTIEKFLGKGYTVKASYGHVRALPSKQGSVDIANDFEPLYKNLPDSQKHLTALKKDLKGCDELILATDPDREGEAIAWHLLEALKIDENGDKPKVKRVVFHEITAGAIKEAMANPRTISKEMVDAQQARSILDYLVGFNLSPFLWKKIRYGLSAGRVQSVALRVICEREKEITAFKSDEYWTIGADMISAGGKGFSARLNSMHGKKIGKLDIGSQAAADEILAALKNADMTISSVTKKQKKRNPAAPFTTSTLQQEANRKLGFSARKTMSVAQKLYEGIDIGDGDVGLTTYMRTDSVALSTVATDEARAVIGERYGKEYALDEPRVFKNKSKNAQEAHEAVRPTSIGNIPQEIKKYLSADQYKLYNLIWTRTIASQMAPAVLDATSVDIKAGEDFLFRASGQVIRFPGFMKVYIEGTDNGGDSDDDEGLLPDLKKDEKVECKELLPEQHFTQPPPRFTEASLVKILEEYGIGRPSTYASIMNTLVTRKYVTLEKRAFTPEDVGMIVSDLLTNHFKQYVDYDFTAKMEEDLDAISRGESQWRPLLAGFWEPFHTLIQQKEKEVSKGDITTEAIDQDCPECGKKLAIKLGKRGKFIACTGFPDCRHTAALSGDNQPEEPVVSDEKCDKCDAPMLIKDGRYGKFYACSAYPECKNIQPLEKPKSTGVVCPECKEGEIQEKKSRYGKLFYSCNRYPKCKYALWNPPIEDPCPECGHVLTTRKTTKRKGTMRVCPIKECGFEEPIIEAETEEEAEEKE